MTWAVTPTVGLLNVVCESHTAISNRANIRRCVSWILLKGANGSGSCFVVFEARVEYQHYVCINTAAAVIHSNSAEIVCVLALLAATDVTKLKFSAFFFDLSLIEKFAQSVIFCYWQVFATFSLYFTVFFVFFLIIHSRNPNDQYPEWSQSGNFDHKPPPKKKKKFSLYFPESTFHSAAMRRGIITVKAARCRASWRLKVLPARSLFNLYQTADSIWDNLKRQREGGNGSEWEEEWKEV